MSLNERITEKIVRDQLQELGYYSNENLIVEEQKSNSPKIDKLLRFASKKGSGRGYPEFIIRSKIDASFIIVIECKASTKYHESKDHSMYAEYAVDGALLYASYLAKEYDVLAIGVSGQTKREIQISQYLHLKGASKSHEYFGNTLNSFDDYLSGYLNSDIKFNQDYSQLLDYTKEINSELHAKKVKEAQRSLLISGILIALENQAFKASYKSHKKASQLAKSLVTTITDEFSNASLPENKIANLKQAFSFVLTHVTLNSNKEFFENLIDSIDSNINSFMKTYKYFDALGQFYIEFLRYANNDKGLGIVLTPPHVTELFSDLAGVNKDSVIYDNCCGTGGFLISAMKKMVIEAHSNSNKVDKIKKSQLVGVEYQDDIYALGISNMILHGDGKTNFYLGNSLKLTDKIKEKFNPDIGMLNPPYKSKKSDTEELEFVLENLNALQKGGKCIAIIPLSCAISLRGDVYELRKRILQNHTLEAVMSMPEDLFHNSKVNVVTCILVLTAHIPHPDNKKTWLGYWRNDGFEKTKGQGRIDLNNVWETTRAKWLSLYLNRESEQGLSITKKLTVDDEWCAEAYLKTDYSVITKKEYKQNVKRYLSYRLLNDLLDVQFQKPEKKSFGKEELVPVDSIFYVKTGLSSSSVDVKDEPESSKDLRYIRPSQTYMGSIAGYVDEMFVENNKIFPANTIYVSTDGQGSHSYSYLSSFKFIPNSNVYVLIPKKEMSIQEKIYYSICISINRYRFSYGRKPKGHRIKKMLIPSSPPEFVYEDVFEEIFNEWKKIVN